MGKRQDFTCILKGRFALQCGEWTEGEQGAAGRQSGHPEEREGAGPQVPGDLEKGPASWCVSRAREDQICGSGRITPRVFT